MQDLWADGKILGGGAVARLVTHAGLNFSKFLVAWLLLLVLDHAQSTLKADERLDDSIICCSRSAKASILAAA